ncbi:MAG TPA: DUF6624 domain-containing protein [Chitinophagaceae bacterium]|jgi:hypothetical protein|nr:DUF6624 domain-containing protein [Chitinophagaceae bacterium]
MGKFSICILLLISYVQICKAQTYDDLAYKGYTLYNQGVSSKDSNLFKQSAKLLQKAADLKQTDQEPLLWDAAMIAAMGKDTLNTILLLKEALKAGLTDVEKVITRPVFDFLKPLPEWKQLINDIKVAERRYVAKLSNKHLREELLKMWAEDQRVRVILQNKVAELNNNWGDTLLKPYYLKLDECDSINFNRIKQIVTKEGWPKLSAVGKDGSFAAWAIVQHSNNISFQKSCIETMKLLIATKEVRAVEYAELVDRVRRNEKLNQLYGMAIKRENGKEEFYPIEDEEHVDERRKAIGLEPLAVYAHLNGFNYNK